MSGGAVAAAEAPEEVPARRARWRLPDALPALGPMAMRVYVAIWSVLLVVAVLLAALGVQQGLQFHHNPGWSALGLTVKNELGGPVVNLVFGTEAKARGVTPGDAILAIDGWLTSPGIGAVDATVHRVGGADGTTRTLTLRTGADAPREVILTRSRDTSEQRFRDARISSLAYYTLLSAFWLVSATLLIASALLLFRQRRQPVAALLSLGFLGVAGVIGGGDALRSLSPQFYSALGTLGWTATLLAVMTMPDGRFAPRWTRWLVVALLIFMAEHYVRIIPDWLITPLAVAAIAGAVAAMGLKYHKLPQGPVRQQLRWAFLGFVVGTALLVSGAVLIPIASALADGNPGWNIWGGLAGALIAALTLCCFALGLLVSLLRYRLYDADAVIGRSAGYALLTLLLAAAFGVTAKLIEMFFETSFARDAGALPGAVGAGLVLTMIAPMHRRIHDWAERRFQKDITRLRRDLPPAVEDLRETAGLDDLLDEALGRIMRGTRATRAAVMIDGAMAARRGDAGAVWPTEAPLRIAHQELGVGTLLVGPRPDGTPVGKDEREALAAIADPLARAIRIVRAREEREAALHHRLAAIERRIAAPLSSRHEGGADDGAFLHRRSHSVPAGKDHC